MTVIYADSVFLLNAMTDYILLLSTARLAGIPLRRSRYVLSAICGGAYAVAVFFPHMEILAAAPIKIMAGTLMALLAYGREEHYFRLLLLFFAVSCGFAGCVLGLGLLLGGIPVVQGVFYTDVNTKILAAAFAAGWLVLRVIFHAGAKHALKGELLPVCLYLGKRKGELNALRDTGNSLVDPLTGQQVMVVAPKVLQCLLPETIYHMIEERNPMDLIEPLVEKMPQLNPRLIPYRAVGVTNGLLLSIRVDQAEIAGESYQGLRIAVSPTPLGNGYEALWAGNAKKGGRP